MLLMRFQTRFGVPCNRFIRVVYASYSRIHVGGKVILYVDRQQGRISVFESYGHHTFGP